MSENVHMIRRGDRPGAVVGEGPGRGAGVTCGSAIRIGAPDPEGWIVEKCHLADGHEGYHESAVGFVWGDDATGLVEPSDHAKPRPGGASDEGGERA